MMKTEAVIYLDMDGVCTDFASAGIIANGFDPEQVFEMWQDRFPAEFLPYNVMGIDKDDYWQAIADQGEAFWTNLKEYPWFVHLYQSLNEIAPTLF